MDTEDEIEKTIEPGFGRDVFLAWRAPRYGKSNPERMNNPFWEWQVKTGQNAYSANKAFDGPSSCDAGPCWCFDRFGQSVTLLPDGRRVLIAGEHEDYYDPDFYIYNDVVVTDADGNIDIYGYAPDCFPPTDFHSATLAGKQIIVVGSLGYTETRKEQTTNVYLLNIDDFSFHTQATTGEHPGWIHDHTAYLSDNGASLLVRGGKLHRATAQTLVENIDDWQLDLESWEWTCIKRRDWPRWELTRADGQRIHLWEIRQAVWYQQVGWETDYHKAVRELRADLDYSLDVGKVENLYSPAVSHEKVPQDEHEFQVYRIRINDVTVRFVESTYGIQLTVEGDLPEHTCRLLVDDVQTKLSELENDECVAHRISNQHQ